MLESGEHMGEEFLRRLALDLPGALGYTEQQVGHWKASVGGSGGGLLVRAQNQESGATIRLHTFAGKLTIVATCPGRGEYECKFTEGQEVEVEIPEWLMEELNDLEGTFLPN